MVPQNNKFQTWYAISLAFQLGFLIAIPLGGFVLLGIWGDQILHSSPAMLILSVIIGIAITIYETYHFILPLIKENA